MGKGGRRVFDIRTNFEIPAEFSPVLDIKLDQPMLRFISWISSITAFMAGRMLTVFGVTILRYIVEID